MGEYILKKDIKELASKAHSEDESKERIMKYWQDTKQYVRVSILCRQKMTGDIFIRSHIQNSQIAQ